MLKLAVKSKLPLIAVTTRDRNSLREVLTELTGLTPVKFDVAGENKTDIQPDHLYYYTGDVKALAESIAWLLEHPQSAARMGRNGRRAIETRFTHRNEVRKLLRFYSRIVTAG